MNHATLIDDRSGFVVAARWLFKRDHPRAIDRYIDYFGGAAAKGKILDPCGEAFLESLEEVNP